jgi:hypothetical protein
VSASRECESRIYVILTELRSLEESAKRYHPAIRLALAAAIVWLARLSDSLHFERTGQRAVLDASALEWRDPIDASLSQDKGAPYG